MSDSKSHSAKLLIAGGGTGGHVFPAIAVAREWLRRAENASVALQTREVVIVGTQKGLEAKLVPEAGLPLETIRVAGLKGMRGIKFVRNAALLAAGFWDSAALLRRHRFAAAFGVGGYASGPMMLLAAATGVPTVLFEPNLEPGFTNRVLARIAKRIATGFEETARRFGAKARATGNPVRKEFFAAPVRDHRPPFTLLITGGSQGAQAINRAMIDSLDLLAEKKNQLFVVHQTGERDYNAVREAYARLNFNAEVSPFIGNMADRFAQADLIICRSGAITVAEIAAAGRAAIFIPFGAATDSHQLRNAQSFEQAGAARVIPQNELTPKRLASEIFSLLDLPAAPGVAAAPGQPGRIQDMEQRARALARPRAVADIVDMIEEVARA
ncbi:MAG TPA: undecaprenyldiphospho-muramoylpentapeptide beta-N-acetylglucosaminyltransferase [Candidatus Limnocylindrales bacterium]|nr:undecaprenyldiphospho-muramoylpentapeptide beta-N-acetylglucosaminyltransferase [Candidatus Limnocylindrales bacterium]